MLAQHDFEVEKAVHGERTVSTVRRPSANEPREEIARMLAGLRPKRVLMRASSCFEGGASMCPPFGLPRKPSDGALFVQGHYPRTNTTSSHFVDE